MNFAKKNTGFTDKYCLSCGAGNPGVAAHCLICGETAFVESFEQYMVAVKDKEVAEIKAALKAENDANVEKLRKKWDKEKTAEIERLKNEYESEIDKLRAEIRELRTADSISGDDEQEEYTFPEVDTSVSYNKSDFQIEGTTLLLHKSKKIAVTVPNGITRIGAHAFKKQNIKHIVIPDSVTEIMGGAFWDCNNLSNINMPAGLTKIGTGAFKCCTSLQTVTLPKTLKSIGVGAFFGCIALRKIEFNGTREQWNAVAKGDNWNYGCFSHKITFSNG